MNKMKRLLLLLVFGLLGMSAFAPKPIKVVSGSKSFLKQGNGFVSVEFKWDEAQWRDDKLMIKALDHEMYEDYTHRAEEKFMQGFNMNSSNLKTSVNEAGTFRMVVEVKKVDHFYSLMSIIPGNKFTLWSVITVFDEASGEKVCVIQTERLKGGRDFGIDDSYDKCFYELGKRVAEL